MLVNLTDVFLSEEKKVKQEYVPKENTFLISGDVYSFKIKEPISLTFTNISQGKVRIEGKGVLIVDMRCDRCLKDVPYEMDLDFSYEVFSPEVSREDTDADEYSFMEGYELNVGNLIDDEILMSWPMKVLCKPQCKGICTVCGKDLNIGECGCDTFVPDPRWAALKDIFNANKEV